MQFNQATCTLLPSSIPESLTMIGSVTAEITLVKRQDWDPSNLKPRSLRSLGLDKGEWCDQLKEYRFSFFGPKTREEICQCALTAVWPVDLFDRPQPDKGIWKEVLTERETSFTPRYQERQISFLLLGHYPCAKKGTGSIESMNTKRSMPPPSSQIHGC